MREAEATGLLSPVATGSPSQEVRPPSGGYVGGVPQIPPCSPSVLPEAPPGGQEGSPGSGGDRSDSTQKKIGREERRWIQWRAMFSAGTDPGIWTEGRLRFSPHSTWLALLDLENDVHAGEPFPNGGMLQVIFRATAWIRTWSLLTHMDSREPLVTGCNQWEMVARAIFNRFGWRSHNRIGV
nr:uncharacterized protein LOC123494323 [Aegilops tauschii subsp. strangulata]